MEKLVLGIDLCNAYTQICSAENEQVWTVPTVICKNKKTDEWYIGEEAYAHTLEGSGIIVDKLLKLVLRDGTATLGDVKYEGKELLGRFLQQVLDLPRSQSEEQEISQLVFSLKRMDSKLIRILYACAEELQIPKVRVRIISHAEGFLYYVLSQKKEIWGGTVGMFDYAQDNLCYYEMKVQRGLKRTLAIAEYENLEEGVNLDVLKIPSGAQLADKILCSCAERIMQKKPYTAVFLTGKGFSDRSWAEGFMKLICTKRRVYMEASVFAKGAAYCSMDGLRDKTAYPYTMVCDGRLKVTISMNVLHKGQESSVVLAAVGEPWLDRITKIDVIPDHQNTVDLVVTPLDVKKKKVISIPIEEFCNRPQRTTKLRISVSFLDERTMDVRLKDLGFGELFPSSGVQIRQEVML